MNLNRRRGGRRAQANGQGFEQIFLWTCRTKCLAVSRMPDGCKQLGANRLIRVKTDFDWIVTYAGRSAFIDTKTIEGQGFPANIIKENQVSALGMHARAGAIGGYVVEFREVGAVSFVHVTRLEKALRDRQQIKFNDPSVLMLGHRLAFDPKLIFQFKWGCS